jgi:protein required for attachment to host cells
MCGKEINFYWQKSSYIAMQFQREREKEERRRLKAEEDRLKKEEDRLKKEEIERLDGEILERNATETD